jgi:hypothetical protein
MNFNRLVKRYHVEVKEIAVPTEEDVLSRKSERVVESLAEAGRRLSLEDFAELGPVARIVSEHELRDRIVAALLKDVLAKKSAVEDDAGDDEDDEGPLPPRRRYESGGGRGRGGDGGRRDGGRGNRRRGPRRR